MRKILYSPDYGAGWSTWNGDETAKYMLEYQPIIDFLESGGKFTQEDCHMTYLNDDYAQPDFSNFHTLLKQLQKECLEKFNNEYVCVLGAPDLVVATVNGRVRIHEYDGSESVEEEGEYEGWM